MVGNRNAHDNNNHHIINMNIYIYPASSNVDHVFPNMNKSTFVNAVLKKCTT